MKDLLSALFTAVLMTGAIMIPIFAVKFFMAKRQTRSNTRFRRHEVVKVAPRRRRSTGRGKTYAVLGVLSAAVVSLFFTVPSLLKTGLSRQKKSADSDIKLASYSPATATEGRAKHPKYEVRAHEGVTVIFYDRNGQSVGSINRHLEDINKTVLYSPNEPPVSMKVLGIQPAKGCSYETPASNGQQISCPVTGTEVVRGEKLNISSVAFDRE